MRRAVLVALAVLAATGLPALLSGPTSPAGPAPPGPSGGIAHSQGRVTLTATDYGRLDDLAWQGVSQMDRVGGRNVAGLVVDHDLYDHNLDTQSNPDDDYYIADAFDSDGDPANPISDFTTLEAVAWEPQADPDLVKTVAEYRHTGLDANDTSGRPAEVTKRVNDIDILETVWTRANASWAIVRYEVLNIGGVMLPSLSLGIYLEASGAGGGVGGDGGDDTDGFDTTEGAYWVRDDTGVALAVASADATRPMDHYHGSAADLDEMSDTELYNAVEDGFAHTLAGGPGTVRALVGFHLGDLAPFTSTTVAFVIAFNATVASVLLNDLAEARTFFSQTYGTPQYVSTRHYVSMVNGELWVIAQQNNTRVTIRDIGTGTTYFDSKLDEFGSYWMFLSNAHVDVTSSKNLTVLSGSALGAGAGGNAWNSLIPTHGGLEIGKIFTGFSPVELRVIAPRMAGDPSPVISVFDASDGDDTVTLTGATASFTAAGMYAWYLSTFDDDVIRITSNVNVTALSGKRSIDRDWSVTPPSVTGSQLGTQFYVYASDTVTVYALRNLTTVDILDLSDGDDTRSVLLNRGEIYSNRQNSWQGYPIVNRSGVGFYHNADNIFEDDYVEVRSDKEILVYVGPTSMDTYEYADLAPTVRTGRTSMEAFAYAQNGAANDFQVFVFDRNTYVNITSLTYSWSGGAFYDFQLGPADWRGLGPWWWEWGGWQGNMLHVESNLPIVILDGDFDGPSYGTFYAITDPPVLVEPQDLTLAPADIGLPAPQPFLEGATVAVTADLHNIGQLPVTVNSNIRVDFLVDGVLASSAFTNATVPANDTATVRVNTVLTAPPSGMHTLSVVIDPLDRLVEWDETNNDATVSFSTAPLEPPSQLTATPNGDELDLSWLPSPSPFVSHYEIYAGPLPYAIDFTAPAGVTAGPTTAWTDPARLAAAGETYYTVVAANATWARRSTNTNTIGRVTLDIPAGLHALSLPLQPPTPPITPALAAQLGATSIQWMNSGAWVSSPKTTQMGEAYLLTFPAATRATYTGLPAAHILYTWGSGFAPATAKVSGTVDPAGNVMLTWTPVPGASSYRVYRATARDGFHAGTATLRATVGTTSWTDALAAAAPGSDYYMVRPLLAGAEGSGSYSVGVETMALGGMLAFGVPIRLDAWPTVASFADQVPEALGLLWLSAGVWVPHFRGMPADAYDAPIEWALGYQIQASGAPRASFVGY